MCLTKKYRTFNSKDDLYCVKTTFVFECGCRCRGANAEISKWPFEQVNVSWVALLSYIFWWKISSLLNLWKYLGEISRVTWSTWKNIRVFTTANKFAPQFQLRLLLKYHMTFPTYTLISTTSICLSLNLSFYKSVCP